MRWLIRTRKPAADALDFCREYSRSYDLFQLKSVRLERGEKPYGVYGWLDYSGDSSGWDKYTMTLHIPGPFPYRVYIREPLLDPVHSENVITTPRGIVFTVRDLQTRSEGLTWLYGHELFHYLASTNQVRANNTEYNADHFANSVLDKYRKK